MELEDHEPSDFEPPEPTDIDEHELSDPDDHEPSSIPNLTHLQLEHFQHILAEHPLDHPIKLQQFYRDRHNEDIPLTTIRYVLAGEQVRRGQVIIPSNAMYPSVEGLNQTWILGTLCLSTKHSLAVSYAIDERSLAMLWCLVHPLRDTESPAGKLMQHVAIHQVFPMHVHARKCSSLLMVPSVVHSLRAHVRRWNDRSPTRFPIFNWVEPLAESVHQYADDAIARHISTDFIADYDPHRIGTLNTLLGAIGLNARNGCHNGSIASDIIVGILSRYAQQHFDLYLQRWQATAHSYRWPDDDPPLPAETTPTQLLQHPAHYGIIDCGLSVSRSFVERRLPHPIWEDPSPLMSLRKKEETARAWSIVQGVRWPFE
ncbi:hypothetical protein SISNIDRAFT_492041 [Sistotremastrum niveocremeum HHB9708]|uniref:Uncharacterized protein n=1 Tax=Sistotremastrum niveocremeum HHB9708 TaxID=1314777 RepID=A0A164M4D8_9AGAM|nr:hypothetical protein SISNIDRAFT_492041 [Sistotremastrum niveocremeum HHB9708]